MKKKGTAPLLQHDFAFASDADLDAQIVAFRKAHEAAHPEWLTMHERRSLGAGRERVTFRVRPAGKK